MTAAAARLDRAATLALAARARRFLIKTRQGVLRLDAGRAPVNASELASHLVHRDGFLNLPVLVLDDLLVRGYTPELYREAVEDRRPST
jgi:hypothetical protein